MKVHWYLWCFWLSKFLLVLCNKEYNVHIYIYIFINCWWVIHVILPLSTCLCVWSWWNLKLNKFSLKQAFTCLVLLLPILLLPSSILSNYILLSAGWIKDLYTQIEIMIRWGLMMKKKRNGPIEVISWRT